MDIVRLQGDASLAALVSRIYGIQGTDPQFAAAQAALLAANPHLQGDVGALPAGTPVVVPDVAGLTPDGASVLDPGGAALARCLDTLSSTIRSVSNAQQTGSSQTPLDPPNPDREDALQMFLNDVSRFRRETSTP